VRRTLTVYSNNLPFRSSSTRFSRKGRSASGIGGAGKKVALS
jgi:hypothetical protein